jgi:hypothetical protein
MLPLVPFRWRKRLGLLQRLVAGLDLRPQPSTRQIIPIEKLRYSAVSEAHLEAAAVRHHLVLDAADVRHRSRFTSRETVGTSSTTMASSSQSAGVSRVRSNVDREPALPPVGGGNGRGE